ncbi:MAG: VTT domain-containing protein [Oscillospiraceae bacterium]|nr:VTT domain-containing protein [Oscillospiraceae bacterium]
METKRISKEDLIKNFFLIFGILLLCISALFVAKGRMDGHFSSIDSMREYVNSYGMFRPVLLTLIQVVQVVLPVVPGMTGCIVGAVLFGSTGGFLINYIGISAGSIIAFFLAKRYGTNLVAKLIPMEKYESTIEKINKSKNYLILLFLSILLPLAPDDFLCYFSGLIKMSTKKFVLIILVSKPWCILFYSLFFSYFI